MLYCCYCCYRCFSIVIVVVIVVVVVVVVVVLIIRSILLVLIPNILLRTYGNQSFVIEAHQRNTRALYIRLCICIRVYACVFTCVCFNVCVRFCIRACVHWSVCDTVSPDERTLIHSSEMPSTLCNICLTVASQVTTV